MRKITEVNGFKVDDRVDVPFVNGYVRLTITAFHLEGNDIYADFDDKTKEKVESLKKVRN